MKNTRGFIADDRKDLIEEWHSTDNKNDTPYNVRVGSDKQITWCCKECGHIWKSQAKSRAIKNTGCPKCHERYNVGFPELAIFYYIKQIFIDAKLNSDIDGLGKYKSVDVLVESLNLVIEYDGAFTHREKFEMDREKSRLTIESGYGLIRIRDNGLDPLKIEGVQEYLYERSTHKTVSKMIQDVLDIIENTYTGYTKEINKIKETVNVDVDNMAILAQIPPIEEKDNLSILFPNISKMWDESRNYGLLPIHFKAHSNHKAWFICDEGHPSLVQINSKTKGHGCRVCKGQVATEEYNLVLLFPEIEREWNYELNNDSPDMYLPYSNEKVYWDCTKCNSTYDKIINERTGGGEGCPYCAGKRVNDTNCLSTTHPELAKEWDYNKNGELTPEKVTKGSHDKVYWICPKGHDSYSAYVYRRTGTKGTGCPKCGLRSPRKVKRENSLAVKKPDLAKQWHPKNERSPFEVGAYAREKHWWLCENGHEWPKAPNSRRSPKCKYCTN
ncbi:zinc-ribbon domain-containing protein [Ornithinibacillus contaminans]|uniref:zinc-ribbon domain-containing protein n=1 Tax=Ornithinibacillus contaminans TaxID=694055 RepID=UPI00069EE01C|nr:zinc-ribbon domain-containing protein [Ornithinibacillus contaminans]